MFSNLQTNHATEFNMSSETLTDQLRCHYNNVRQPHLIERALELRAGARTRLLDVSARPQQMLADNKKYNSRVRADIVKQVTFCKTKPKPADDAEDEGKAQTHSSASSRVQFALFLPVSTPIEQHMYVICFFAQSPKLSWVRLRAKSVRWIRRIRYTRPSCCVDFSICFDFCRVRASISKISFW